MEFSIWWKKNEIRLMNVDLWILSSWIIKLFFFTYQYLKSIRFRLIGIRGSIICITSTTSVRWDHVWSTLKNLMRIKSLTFVKNSLQISLSLLSDFFKSLNVPSTTFPEGLTNSMLFTGSVLIESPVHWTESGDYLTN